MTEQDRRATVRYVGNVHHIITGHNVSPRSVARAIELSETKYCSVAATLRPTVEILSSFETIGEETRSDVAKGDD